MHHTIRERLRASLGRTPQPSAAIVVDSQSAKTSGVGGEARGYGRTKQVRGRKRHILVDTEGFVLKVKVHSASVPDQDGIRLLLEESACDHLPCLSHLWVDAGYQERGKEWAENVLGLSVEVVRKDYERLCATDEAFIYVAMTRLMVRRLSHAWEFSNSLSTH